MTESAASMHYQTMNRFYIFVVRAILGGLIAMLMMRFFYPGASLIYTGLLGVFLVFMAYMTEHFRTRYKKQKENDH